MSMMQLPQWKNLLTLPQTQPPLPSTQVEDGRLDCIRRKLLTKGFTSDVFNLLVSKFKVPSETRGTLHTYQTTWEKFTAYCESKSLDRASQTLSQWSTSKEPWGPKWMPTSRLWT